MTRPRPSSPRAGRRSSPTSGSPRSPSNHHVEGRRRPRHRSGVRRRQRGLSSGRAGGDRHRARRRRARRRHVRGKLRLDELLQQDPARLPRSERRGHGGARRPLEGAGRRLAPPGRRPRLGGDPRRPRPARPGGWAPPRPRVPGRLIAPAPAATALRRPIHAPGCHFRPDGGGRIVLAEGEHDQVWAEVAEPWPPERSLATVAAHLPPLAGARVEATRIGVRPMPRDERPMVGAIPGLDGFYVVASHSGVTLGPLWGRVATAQILDGALNPRPTPYRPPRFLWSVAGSSSTTTTPAAEDPAAPP